MARPIFWPTNDSYTESVGGFPYAGVPVRIYTRQTGGSQVTDLLYVGLDGSLGGAVPSGVLISDSNGLIPAFAGPDGGATTLWGNHGMQGERIALTSDPTGTGGGGGATGAQALAPTAVKSSAYTATPGDFIPVDTTAGPVTITLPSAPADKTRVGVKHIIQGTTNVVTVALAGGDVLNKAGGSTSASLSLPNQGATYQYKSAGAIWYVTEADVPLTALNTTFAAKAGAVYTGAHDFTGATVTGVSGGGGGAGIADDTDGTTLVGA